MDSSYERATIEKYRAAGCWGNQTIPERLAETVRERGDSVALMGALTFTYRQLWDEVLRVASGLQSHGVGSGEHVVLQMPNDESFVTTFLAVLTAGAVPVLALPGHREFELRHLVGATRAKTLVVARRLGNHDCSAMIAGLVGGNSSIERLFVLGGGAGAIALESLRREDDVSVPTEPDATAFFLLSGGTTGLPKLIPRRHAEYVYNCQISARNAGLGHASRYLAVLPMAHNFALGCPGVLGTLLAGGTIVMSPNTSAESNLPLIEQHGITHTALVPSLAHFWSLARQRHEGTLSSLEVIQVGGARVSPDLARAVLAAFPGTLQQSYGMGEGLLSQTQRHDGEEILLRTQGRPISPHDEIRIVDPDGGIITERPASGELQVRGPYTILGYFDAEKHNARAFTTDGFFCTGDRATLNADGTLTIEGRLNDVINRGGDKIGPDEIEDHLLHHPAIREAAAVAVDDEIMGHRVCAAITATKKLRLIDVNEFLRARGVADFKLPDRLVLMEGLPMTAFGKVDRKRIRALVNVR